MKPIFAITLREGAEAARCDGCPENLFTDDASYWTSVNILALIGALLGLATIITITILTVKIISNKIKHKEEFSGAAWGFLNGILGIGVVATIIAYYIIRKRIERIKNKQYAEYAKREMIKFIYIYFLCAIFWIIFGLAIRQ